MAYEYNLILAITNGGWYDLINRHVALVKKSVKRHQKKVNVELGDIHGASSDDEPELAADTVSNEVAPPASNEPDSDSEDSVDFDNESDGVTSGGIVQQVIVQHDDLLKNVIDPALKRRVQRLNKYSKSRLVLFSHGDDTTTRMAA